MSRAKMPKQCQGTGGNQKGRAEEQSGDQSVLRGTEQQQSKELQNKEQDKEKAKASTDHLSRCGQRTGMGAWVSQLESLLAQTPSVLWGFLHYDNFTPQQPDSYPLLYKSPAE